MKNLMLMIPVALSLLACGSLKSPKQTVGKSASIVSGANLAVGQCQPMMVQSNTYYSSEENAISGFTACATSDASVVKIRYDMRLSAGARVCLYPVNGTAAYIVPGNCFTPTSTGGEVNMQFSGVTFQKVLLTESSHSPQLEAALRGEANFPLYSSAIIR